MVSQTLELKHKRIVQEAAERAAQQATQKATKDTVLSMLMEMKIDGIPKQAIVKMAKKRNIPDEEINRILESQG